MKKRFVSLLLAVALFAIPQTGFAAKNSDVIRIYKKVVTKTDFVEKLHKTVFLYRDLNVTEESVNEVVKELIYKVIDIATLEKENGILTKENIEERFKDILMNEVQNLDAVYLSLILDSFPEETVENLLSGIIPDEFKEIYRLLAKDAYYILGYMERDVDIIFDDMEGYEWSYVAVDYLFNKDIINGTSDFIFQPSLNVTREQFVKMVCCAFPIKEGTAVPHFSDVSENEWYYPYVTKMASAGLIKGLSENTFGVGSNISRQDMAVLMYRIGEALGYLKPEAMKFSFNDYNSISNYALTSVNTLRNHNILKGDDLGNFNPKSGATRAEAAQMIYNFYIFVLNQNS